MQQTTKYKLNLIETSDPFSPAPLNENAQKTEALLQALETGKADAADTNALGGRVTALEAHHVMVGSYKGNGAAQRTIELGFTPEAVLVVAASVSGNLGYAQVLLITKDEGRTHEKIVDGGFSVTSSSALNSTSNQCGFIAIA